MTMTVMVTGATNWPVITVTRPAIIMGGIFIVMTTTATATGTITRGAMVTTAYAMVIIAIAMVTAA